MRSSAQSAAERRRVNADANDGESWRKARLSVDRSADVSKNCGSETPASDKEKGAGAGYCIDTSSISNEGNEQLNSDTKLGHVRPLSFSTSLCSVLLSPNCT